MIDYIALSIGHGIIAIALLRLVTREGLDVDPLLDTFRKRERPGRKARANAAEPSQQRSEASPIPEATSLPNSHARRKAASRQKVR